SMNNETTDSASKLLFLSNGVSLGSLADPNTSLVISALARVHSRGVVQLRRLLYFNHPILSVSEETKLEVGTPLPGVVSPWPSTSVSVPTVEGASPLFASDRTFVVFTTRGVQRFGLY